MSVQRSSTSADTDLSAYIRQQLDRAQTSVQALLRPGIPRPTALHDLHRDLRRLRVIVTWRRKLKPSADSELVEELVRRLRRLTRLAGRVRDLDIELALWLSFRPGTRGVEPHSHRALATFGHRLQDDSRTGRELLKATLLAELNAGFFDRIRFALSGVASPASTRALQRALTEERRRLADRAARMRRRALRDPDSERLHQFRILIRRLRYLSDLEDRLVGRRGSTFPARYARVLRRLGELHDRDVLAAHLDAVDPSQRVEAWSQRFRKEHQRLRKDLLRELEDLHPRRHLGRARSLPA